MHKLKIVGGFAYPDEKGITIPPEQTIEARFNMNDYVVIPVQKTRRKETER